MEQQSEYRANQAQQIRDMVAATYYHASRAAAATSTAYAQGRVSHGRRAALMARQAADLASTADMLSREPISAHTIDRVSAVAALAAERAVEAEEWGGTSQWVSKDPSASA